MVVKSSRLFCGLKWWSFVANVNTQVVALNRQILSKNKQRSSRNSWAPRRTTISTLCVANPTRTASTAYRQGRDGWWRSSLSLFTAPLLWMRSSRGSTTATINFTIIIIKTLILRGRMIYISVYGILAKKIFTSVIKELWTKGEQISFSHQSLCLKYTYVHFLMQIYHFSCSLFFSFSPLL